MAANYHDTRLGGVSDGSTKFNITPKKLRWAERDVMGTVFCGCQQFSRCTESGQRQMLVVSITGSLYSSAAGWICLTAIGHTLRSRFHYGHGLGMLHRHSAQCKPFFWFWRCMFWTQKRCLGNPLHLPVKIALDSFPTIKKMNAPILYLCTDWPVLGWSKHCDIDTRSLEARKTI